MNGRKGIRVGFICKKLSNVKTRTMHDEYVFGRGTGHATEAVIAICTDADHDTESLIA